MRSKEKFWYRAKDGEPEWLFKFPQPNTGQHWAEKIAAEVAACMDILHGVVELAVFQGTRGSIRNLVQPPFLRPVSRFSIELVSVRHGADGGGRTHTVALPPDFESGDKQHFIGFIKQ